MSARKVRGCCPMGCGDTLMVSGDGYIICSLIGCPRPDAVFSILAEREAEHIVQFEDGVFTVRHPLRERLDDALLTCTLHHYIANLPGPPIQPGLYRARGSDGRWTWEAT